MIADATPIHMTGRRINVGAAAVVGQVDNDRPSSRTYATAAGTACAVAREE
jgi:hypothetical protein